MELLVYKASAGSGKTFTLAVEYIKHLILNPKAYQQILAVTFTNKATAEMKERILQQLYGIWIADPASEPYLNRIREDLQQSKNLQQNKDLQRNGDLQQNRDPQQNKNFKALSESDIRRAAGTALQYMLHDYSRFRVETIDSFFQSVMRNLARELELSPNLNIELNNAEVLSDSVDSLIEKLTPSSPVLTWLLDYINERIADDKRWNVSDEIKRFGWNIFDEGYIERGKSLRQQLKQPDTIKQYRNQLREKETEALEQMKSFYDQFTGELEAHALTPEDLKGGSRGISSYFRKLNDGRLTDKDVVNATLKNSLDDARNWATKTSTRKNDIIHLVETSLLPLLQNAETFRPRNNKTVNSCRLSLQHLNKLQLLAHIDEEVRELNREHNRFLLSDTNALLHNLVGDGDSSFVFEKIGASIRNVMIDEFQDTSRMQWDNFRILLQEGLSQGANSLIVGDVKQSIYRWRNGDWGILNALGTKETPFPFPVRVETLKTNRRSETNIIRFNNTLFTAAVEYLNLLHLKELQEDCRPLQRAYADATQESPRTEAKGYIKATFLEADEEHNYTELTIISLGEEVQRLLEAGVKLNDITILVRKNKNIPLIADYFDKTMHLPIVSDEAFRLDASQALCMLIDALRYLSNPEDRIARASLITNYRLQSTDWDKLFTASPEAMLPESFVSRMETLRLMPLYELLEELFSLFEMHRIEEQDAYLFSFFDAVTDYLQNNSSDLDAFIRHWDETLCGKTIPSGEMDGIRILSIHKSKGLEFHTVLIPFCDWKLENETNNQLIWCSPTEEPYNALDIVPVNYSSTMAESVYRQDYLDERLQLWVDNLNLLYVAFTRAGKNLIFWSKKGQKGTISELLANALAQVSAREDNENWNEEEPYESGKLCPSDKESCPAESPGASSAESPGASSQTVASSPRTPVNRLSQKPEKLPIHIESMRHDIEFRQSNRSADFIRGVEEEESDSRFIHRGQLLHTLFSAIETEKDIDNAIQQLVFEGIIGTPEAEKEIQELTRHAFSLTQVQDWYSGEWLLFNECDIIWQENGELRTRRPDRVMMRGNEIVVIDLKFGKQNKKHNKQVQEYMLLLTNMGYSKENIKGFLWYVEEDLIINISTS
ncbi:UvrD-helicase domain-containing protein [Bacteroides sp. UBA939]|uniref:UvrD-helicase domain-containing protein n=1 Tax=Bacteroides sp. UBA939 TaxID=1946092 RepID=UPI0025C2D616|nr:UvrD-helicase domain-containing protein [Bacteroides sp. UBA939]